jgi:hypothetical protein
VEEGLLKQNKVGIIGPAIIRMKRMNDEWNELIRFLLKSNPN